MERARLGFPTPWLRRGRLTVSGSGAALLAEAHDRFHLGGEDPVEMVEAQDLEDVEDGLVQVREAQVAAVRPDLLDRPHDGPESGARDIGEPRAVDHDLEALLLQALLELALEKADGMGVDEALGIEKGHALDVPRFNRQLAHAPFSPFPEQYIAFTAPS